MIPDLSEEADPKESNSKAKKVTISHKIKSKFQYLKESLKEHSLKKRIMKIMKNGKKPLQLKKNMATLCPMDFKVQNLVEFNHSE